jgi:antitoxin (DNA-binding transcriptional repressor) of toxin-antitoxin stability system
VKKVTASEARRHWFRLLDEAAQGEVILLERRGLRLVLRRQLRGGAATSRRRVAYGRLLRVPQADRADRWSWEWRGPGRNLRVRRRPIR